MCIYGDICVHEWCTDVLNSLAESNRYLDILDEMSLNVIDKFITDF